MVPRAACPLSGAGGSFFPHSRTALRVGPRRPSLRHCSTNSSRRAFFLSRRRGFFRNSPFPRKAPVTPPPLPEAKDSIDRNCQEGPEVATLWPLIRVPGFPLGTRENAATLRNTLRAQPHTTPSAFPSFAQEMPRRVIPDRNCGQDIPRPRPNIAWPAASRIVAPVAEIPAYVGRTRDECRQPGRLCPSGVGNFAAAGGSFRPGWLPAAPLHTRHRHPTAAGRARRCIKRLARRARSKSIRSAEYSRCGKYPASLLLSGTIPQGSRPREIAPASPHHSTGSLFPLRGISVALGPCRMAEPEASGVPGIPVTSLARPSQPPSSVVLRPLNAARAPPVGVLNGRPDPERVVAVPAGAGSGSEAGRLAGPSRLGAAVAPRAPLDAPPPHWAAPQPRFHCGTNPHPDTFH
jgi:hypothetical protein